MEIRRLNLAAILWGALIAAVILPSLFLLTTARPSSALLPALAVAFLASLPRMHRYWFFAVVFLIPFGAYRSFGPMGLVRLHWIIAFFLLAWVCWDHVVNRKPLTGFASNLWIWIFLFLSANFASACLSSEPLPALKSFGLLVAGFLFFALGLVMVSERGFFRDLPWVIIWSISVSSLLSVLGFAFNIPLFAENIAGMKRGVGAVPDANNMALMIVFAVPLLAHFFHNAPSFWGRVAILAILGICLTALVTTYSRGGALILCLVTAILAMSHRRRLQPVHLGILLACLAAIFAAGFFLVPQSYWERQKSIADTSDFAVNRRASYLKVGWGAFLQRPLLGSGPDSFRHIYSRSEYARRFMKKNRVTAREAHNTYLEVLVGSGLVGFFFFAGILVRSLSNFSAAGRALVGIGDAKGASLVAAYKISFLSILLYLFIFSDVHHKYLLLSLALSEVSVRVARERGRSLAVS